MWRGGDWQAGSCLGLNRALLLLGSHSRGHTQAACEDSRQQWLPSRVGTAPDPHLSSVNVRHSSCGICFLDQGLNPGPLRRQRRVLGTGPSGNSRGVGLFE